MNIDQRLLFPLSTSNHKARQLFFPNFIGMLLAVFFNQLEKERKATRFKQYRVKITLVEMHFCLLI